MFGGKRIKVKVKRGGFFYEGGIVQTDEERELPKNVGESWVNAGIAEEVKKTRGKPSGKRQSGPSEATLDGPGETR